MAETSIEWTDATWKSGCGLHHPLAGLYKLLRDADGGRTRSHVRAEICRPNPQEWRSISSDRKNQVG